VRALLCDRDGTLVVDVPYNRQPSMVRPMPTVPRGLDDARAAGWALAIVSNQSGVGLGRIAPHELDAVNAAVEAALGPFGAVVVCPHAPDHGCACRKPAPGLVLEAARRLGVAPHDCVVIGDTGADVDAAHRAGANAVLVPNERTRVEEIDAAPVVAPTFASGVELALAMP
jgi:D-glycero-D-manno-heptose 1,7-bisphosphate phosphatase